MKIVFTVTNDLNFDQRMHRICNSLQHAGFEVTLVGTKTKKSQELTTKNFKQKRIKVWFTKGFLFYAEYNLKLFFYLLFTKANAYCAIDLDTIVAVYLASSIKQKKKVYDAHELFTELNEVVSRPGVYKVWKFIEKTIVPKFKYGYTVNNFIKDEFAKRYGVKYEVIRNLSSVNNILPVDEKEIIKKEKTILYQGAVNKGRGFEQLIPAMKQVNAVLHIYGKGNFLKETEQLIADHQLQDKVILKGSFLPQDLKTITPNYYIGITIFEAKGLNQIYSLANRFFDYMMAGIPQICVAYPEYEILNNEYKFAYLIPNIETHTIATALNNLLENDVVYNELKQNAIKTRGILNWETEEIKLINFWKSIFI